MTSIVDVVDGLVYVQVIADDADTMILDVAGTGPVRILSTLLGVFGDPQEICPPSETHDGVTDFGTIGVSEAALSESIQK